MAKHMYLKKITTISMAVLITIIVILFALEAYMLSVDHGKRTTPLPRNYLNSERVSTLLTDDKKDEFSFAVAGDTRSFGTFEKICSQLADEPLSFIVILGDFVQKGTWGEHQYYRCEIGETSDFPYPVFHLVGNHELGKGFTLRDFEETYGQTNFSFSHQGHLFIILRTLPLPYPAEETLAFLEQELSTKRNLHDKVFVFTHIPPYTSPDYPSRPMEHHEKFVELFEKYHVDYVFSGDYHGYARSQANNINYIVTGGGGAPLKYKTKYGNFHHAIVIKVKDDVVSEHILSVDDHVEIEDRIEHLAIADVSPWIMDHKTAALLLNLLGFTLLVFAFSLLIKNRWR